MKYTLEQIDKGEDEVILKYREMTPEVEKIHHFMTGERVRYLTGYIENDRAIITKKDLLYIESVEGKSFGYTADEVYRLEEPLNQLMILLDDIRFFRCSKSMIINIDQVSRLKSMPGNRIDVTMKNNEHIVISRTYASDFRRRLRGE